MSRSSQPAVPDATRGPARIAAGVVGAVFLVVGILGFIPGVTTGYDDLGWAGHHSTAMLFGLFQVSILHNIVHLLFGAAGLAAAAVPAAARGYLIGGGAVYLLLWLYGLLVDPHSGANFVPLNTADNWLHLVLGVGMIGLGLVVRRGRGRR
ncbi:DUF4383 domain-containing protein [Streptomonospora nanhaiensis]|uniref:DUF4383 domain-containing protein n=1 Tax=Streptomonospora nanhaiensis TaxID=1323731 RepID=A0A853BJH5_9ACTN|nr:DUF4383 domain-containing protein [Streptomonospora nanhaiensis]MBV2364223.1 DUF4383 domain-containing protein [Streptomonospora nanhaiensis]MBX9386657.1 DUF4383 domain-containing protein [Streptomonospora nanhaiensis]NYI95180.1 hypothetical protein [Streptomonospora nanhaiensis]